LETHRLIPHPAHPPLAVTHVEARVIGSDEAWLRLRWRIEDSSRLVVPAFGGKGRANGLWRTTCFEAFLRPERGQAYVELNLSPSERWNAYDFSSHREGMLERPMPHEPVCTLRRGRSLAIFDAAIPIAALPSPPCELGFACVLEEIGGRLSYWALGHRDGAPDFHDPACFTARLPAADAR
jgi:hypothetical protein